MKPIAICTLAAAALLAATAVRAAPPGAVAVVCDTEIAPYRELVGAFTKAAPLPVRVMAPPEAARHDLEARLRREGVRAVLAVGMEAREAVGRLRDLPVLAVMTPQVEPWVEAQANRLGIVMALPPRRHLETILQVFPRARRVGVVFDPAQAGRYVAEATAARGLGLTLVTREISRPAELFGRLGELRGRVDVLWLLPDPTVLQGANLDALLLTSFESRTPLYAFARKYVEMGAVAAAHIDPAAMGAQAAAMLASALDQASSPAPPRWRYAAGATLIVNRQVARKLGIDLDPALLKEADDVVR